jgi:hypothetical protein
MRQGVAAIDGFLLTRVSRKLAPISGGWGLGETGACALGESTTANHYYDNDMLGCEAGRSIAGRVGVIATRWPIVWGGHCRTDGSGPNSGGANPYPHARTHVGSAINTPAINAATIGAATIDASCANTTRAESSAPS